MSDRFEDLDRQCSAACTWETFDSRRVKAALAEIASLREEVERLTRERDEAREGERALSDQRDAVQTSLQETLAALDEARASLADRETLEATLHREIADQRAGRLVAEAECARLRAEGERLRLEAGALSLRVGDANVLASEVQKLIDRKVIDSRSPAADALLDYVDPGPNENVPEKIAAALRPSAPTPDAQEALHPAAPIPKEDAPRCANCAHDKAADEDEPCRSCLTARSGGQGVPGWTPRSPASDAAPRCEACGGRGREPGDVPANGFPRTCRACGGSGRSPSTTPTKEK